MEHWKLGISVSDRVEEGGHVCIWTTEISEGANILIVGFLSPKYSSEVPCGTLCEEPWWYSRRGYLLLQVMSMAFCLHAASRRKPRVQCHVSALSLWGQQIREDPCQEPTVTCDNYFNRPVWHVTFSSMSPRARQLAQKQGLVIPMSSVTY